jgi:hypothetical protein
VPAVLALAAGAAVLALVWNMAAHRSEMAEAGFSDIKSDEVVLFYPTLARADLHGRSWTVPIHGCTFAPQSDSARRTLLAAAIRRILGLKLDAQQKSAFETRLRLFLVDDKRGKTIWVRIGPHAHQVGTSGPNGHFQGQLRVSSEEVEDLARDGQIEDGWLRYEALLRPDDARRFSGRVLMAAPAGLAVVSDIDDTIKITDVRDRRAMLANTFVRPFRPVPGMPELYRRLAAANATFHYLTASPWQLYEPLRDFCREAGFPPGTFHMKDFRLTDSSVLNLFGSQQEYKTRAIEEILAALPGRRFVLVGDSGEQDPEVYAGIARSHPKQVAAIFIRNVTGEPPKSDRLRKALEGVPPDRWRLFDQPSELEPTVARLIASEASDRRVGLRRLRLGGWR